VRRLEWLLRVTSIELPVIDSSSDLLRESVALFFGP
jgi:hypothetical protein